VPLVIVTVRGGMHSTPHREGTQITASHGVASYEVPQSIIEFPQLPQKGARLQSQSLSEVRTVAGRASAYSQEASWSPAGSSAKALCRQVPEGRLSKERLPIEESSGAGRASVSSSEGSESPAVLDGLP